MANVRFMYDNLIDSATLTESSQQDTLPAENIQNHLKTKVWRTGATVASEYVVIDMGSAQSVTCVVIHAHNLTASDTGIALEGNTADSWGAPAFTQSLTRVDGPISAYFAAQSYRYWRITFTKSSSAETRDIGRVFLGTYYEAVQNITPTGLNIRKTDTTKTDESIGGQSYADIRPIRRDISLSFSNYLHAQYTQFEVIADAVGIHTPLFVSLDHDSEPVTWLYYVKFKSLHSDSPYSVGSTKYWSSSMQLSEQL